jgi:hypothetical protein
VIVADHQGQIGLPETNDPGRFFLFIPVDPQIDPGRQSIQILGDPALRIESFGISQVIDQIGELTSHFVRVRSWLILILSPLINIFFNKETFSHWKNLALYLPLKHRKRFVSNREAGATPVQ